MRRDDSQREKEKLTGENWRSLTFASFRMAAVCGVVRIRAIHVRMKGNIRLDPYSSPVNRPLRISRAEQSLRCM